MMMTLGLACDLHVNLMIEDDDSEGEKRRKKNHYISVPGPKIHAALCIQLSGLYRELLQLAC